MSQQAQREEIQMRTKAQTSPIDSVRALLRKTAIGATALLVSLSGTVLIGGGTAGATEGRPDAVTDLSAEQIVGTTDVKVHFTPPNMHGTSVICYQVVGTPPGGDSVQSRTGCADDSGNVTFKALSQGKWTFTEVTSSSRFESAPSNSTEVNVVGLTPSTPTITNLPGSGKSGGFFVFPSVETTGDGNKTVTSSTTSICTVVVIDDEFMGRTTFVNYIGVGTCTLVAHVAQGWIYAAADGVPQSFTISSPKATPSSPSITNLPESGIYGGSFTPVVSTTGDGSTSTTSSTASVCTVTAGVVTYIGAGTCQLVAHVAEGLNYSAADGAVQSFEVAAAAPSVPGKPVLVDNHGSFGLTWTEPTSLGGAPVTYSVFEATNGGAFVKIATGVTGISYTAQGTTGYNTYAFRVQATNSAGSSAVSPYGWLQAKPIAPSVPGQPVLTDNHGSILATWSAPTSTGGAAVTYSVRVKTGSGNPVIVARGLASTSFTFASSTAGKTYRFSVAAVNSVGLSPWSESTSVHATAVKPSDPLELVATYASGSLHLNWSAPVNTGGDKVTYVISQMFNHGRWTNLQGQLKTTSYTSNVTLEKGAYVFTVVAVNSAGKSGWSEPALLTVK